jgi:hypothetical protein
MTPTTEAAITAIAIGALGTVVIHVSKGMMRHGVILVARSRETTHPTRRTAWAFYIFAIVLNHTNPIWIIWANMYAAPAYYTSIYGIGLVTLLIYSATAIGEPIGRGALLGSAVIIVGTVAIGSVPIRMPVPAIDMLRVGVAIATMAAAFLAAAVFLTVQLVAHRGTRRTAIPGLELAFGIVAGLLSSYDPILKAIGQRDAGAGGIVPSTPYGWTAFILSFLVAFAAFATTNWGFFRGCRVSVMVATFNATYVTMPVVVQLVALPGYSIGVPGWIGLLLVNVGIMMVRATSRIEDRPQERAAVTEPPHTSAR